MGIFPIKLVSFPETAGRRGIPENETRFAFRMVLSIIGTTVPARGTREGQGREMAAPKTSTEPQWITVSTDEEQEETKIVFDTIGDQFTGKYLGTRTIEPSDPTERPYVQARFEGEDGEIYFTNLGFSLRKGLRDVRAGHIVRITYANDLDTGQASPMRVFKVEVAKNTAVTARKPSGNT